MTEFKTGICIHCGADIGIHKFQTEHCPRNGREEARFDRLTGKYFPQEWQETKFEDSGTAKLHQHSALMYETLKELVKISHNAISEYPPVNKAFSDWRKMAENVINKIKP